MESMVCQDPAYDKEAQTRNNLEHHNSRQQLSWTLGV
jgi:hypothetical protein